MRHPQLVGIGEMHRVQCLTVDVELQLRGGAIADTDRAGSAIPLEMVEDELVEIRYMISSGRGALGGLLHAIVEPLQVRLRLRRLPQTHKRVDRERRVPDPGEAVIRVAVGGQPRSCRDDLAVNSRRVGVCPSASVVWFGCGNGQVASKRC